MWCAWVRSGKDMTGHEDDGWILMIIELCNLWTCKNGVKPTL